MKRRRQGCGLVGRVLNRIVDALPVELHLPGYRFCGPGTQLSKRLARGEHGINELDEACREHDIAYSQYKDNERRRIADRILAGKAWKRVKAWNSGLSERAYAASVLAAMKAKAALGGGCKKKKKKKMTTTKKTGGGGCKTKKKKKKPQTTRASGLYLRPYRKN